MPRTRPQKYAPGLPERRVLHALSRYHYLTVDQVIALYYRPSLYSFVKKVLRNLTVRGYLFKDEIPSKANGNPAGVWSLAGKGRTWCAEQGLLTLPKPKNGFEHWDLFLEHTLSINDWLIALELFVREHPDYELVTVLHDLVLKRTIQPVPKPGGGYFSAVPDAWVEVWHEGQQIPLWLELDLSGKEEEKSWREKVRNIVAFIEGSHYKALVGTDAVTVAVPVMKGERRRDYLIHWTEKELEALGKKPWGDIFRFSAVDFRTADRAEYFTASSWLVPFAGRVEGLL